MARIATLCVFLIMLVAACVIYENEADEVAPGCGPEGQSQDGGHCLCIEDCITANAGAICLDEHTTGMPGGMCDHHCTTNSECGAGFLCNQGFCMARCETTEDCESGRACEPNADATASACVFLCDEPADCKNGQCNQYSGLCLRPDEVPAGAGVAAPCTAHTDCLSTVCLDGACMSRCDPSFDRCPDSATCVSGLCLLPCTTSADCAGYGTPTCVDSGMGTFCFY